MTNQKDGLEILIDARLYGSAQAAGIGVYTEELVKRVLEMGEDNHFHLLFNKNGGSLEKYYPNVERHYTTAGHYSLAEQFKLPMTLNRIDPDLMHFTNFNVPALFSVSDYVVTIHDLTLLFYPGKQSGPIKNAGYRFVMKRTLERAKRIIAISKHTKKDIIEHFDIDPERISVIYQGVKEKIDRVEDEERIEKTIRHFGITKPYLLYVGQWRKHKNLVRLLRAFHLFLRRSDEDFQLVLVGKKQEKHFPEVPETIKRLGLKGKVIMTGFVSDDELPVFYSGARAFAFPSLYEGFGIPPLEAMHADVPVVASNASVIPETLGDAALFFDPRDVEDMADKIGKIMTNYALRQQLIEKGQKQIQKYSYDKMTKEILELYHEVASE